jgi:hypothetical protein
MDESQIVADLAAALPKTEIPNDGWDKVREQQTPTPPEEFVDKVSAESQLEKIKLSEYFNLNQIDRRSAEADKYISRIMDWARAEAGSSDYADILRVINEQERVMGNLLKTNRLTNLYRFVAIRATRDRLIQEERVLYS